MSVNIVTTTSPNYDDLYSNWFKKSLNPEKNNITLHTQFLDLSSFSEFGFGTDSWYFATGSKIKYLLEVMLSQTDEGDYIIYSDADIQFFQPNRITDLIDQARQQNLEYYGMRENDSDYYNTGFMIVKNTEGIRNMLEEAAMCILVKKERLPFADQSIINDQLIAKDLRRDFIPKVYTLWGIQDMTDKDPIFHHAICCKTTQQKLNQMIVVLEKYHKHMSKPV